MTGFDPRNFEERAIVQRDTYLEPVAWRVTYASGEVVFLSDKPVGDSGVYECEPLFARPASRTVTDAMVARASAEYQEIFGRYLLSSHSRRILKAAMEAGRHD